MRLRHVVLLTFAETASVRDREAARDALRTLPAEIPEIEAYSVGLDAGLSAGNATMAIVADFASEGDFAAYVAHDAHQRVISERIAPFLAGRAAVQFPSEEASP